MRCLIKSLSGTYNINYTRKNIIGRIIAYKMKLLEIKRYQNTNFTSIDAYETKKSRSMYDVYCNTIQ